MFCFNCGAKVEDGSVFCDKCGALMSDGPENVQKQAGKISGCKEPVVVKTDELNTLESLQAEEQTSVQAKRPWASSLSSSTADKESVVSSSSQSFEPPSLREEQNHSDDTNFWGGPYKVEIIENEQLPSDLGTSESVVSKESTAKTDRTPELEENGKESRSKGFNLEGKTLYIVIAAVAVVVVVLLVALLGKSCSANSASNQTTATPTSQATNNAQGTSASQTSEVETFVIENDGSMPFWGAWTFASKNKGEAEKYADNLDEKGFESIVVLSSDWSNLNSGDWYCVTTGTWPTESDADKMVSELKSAGYDDAYSKYTGDSLFGDSDVILTVETATGETLSGKVRRDSNNYVLADSSNREYSLSELRDMNLTSAELCIAWNEPFARGGYHFKNPDLRAYFESTGWYVDEGKSFSLSGAAATNNSRLRQLAEENSESKKWEDLATS